MCTASSRVAASRRDGKSWIAVQAAAFSCRCACCRGCSDDASSKGSQQLPCKLVGCSSSESTTRVDRRQGVRRLDRSRCADASGSSMPSVPSPGPKAVLAYLSRYTHRVAISNSRLARTSIERGVTFRWKDYRDKDGTHGQIATQDDDARHRRSSCGASCCMCCRGGFHRIRHYGLAGQRQCVKDCLALARAAAGPCRAPTPIATEAMGANDAVRTAGASTCRHCGAAAGHRSRSSRERHGNTSATRTGGLAS